MNKYLVVLMIVMLAGGIALCQISITSAPPKPLLNTIGIGLLTIGLGAMTIGLMQLRNCPDEGTTFFAAFTIGWLSSLFYSGGESYISASVVVVIGVVVIWVVGLQAMIIDFPKRRNASG